eukprot:5004665-Alexandrium_andersonii.AAC.1
MSTASGIFSQVEDRPAKSARRASSAAPSTTPLSSGGRSDVMHVVGLPSKMWRAEIVAFGGGILLEPVVVPHHGQET